MPHDSSSIMQEGPSSLGSTWLRRETVDEAVWRGAQPAMHLVIPQHSKAARRNSVTSDLRVAIKTASKHVQRAFEGCSDRSDINTDF